MTRSETETADTDAKRSGVPVHWHELTLAFDGARPLAPPSRWSLAGIGLVRMGRAPSTRVERSLVGARWVLDIGLDDPLVSREHATLERGVDGIFRIVDLGSRNGTSVGGRDCREPTPVGDGEPILLGRTALVLRGVQARRGEPPPFDLPVPKPVHPTLVTMHSALDRAFQDLGRVLAARRTVVIVRGPTGSGKEIVAHAVHAMLGQTGRRGDFVALNCAAVPATLIEAELFGARRGAFSGALEERAGLVRAADDGTLFLDEIGDLALASQAALLRVLETREVLPIGGSRPIPTDTAFVAATHRDLESMMTAGHFRPDLYARLAGFEIHLPALRDRFEDMGLIVAALLREAGAAEMRFGADATRALFAHDWPLNVRELHSALGRAVPLAQDGVVRSEHLASPARRAPRADGAKNDRSDSPRQELSGDLRTRRDASICERVKASLIEHNGNVAAVARALGEHRRQVQRWMDRFGLVADHYRVR